MNLNNNTPSQGKKIRVNDDHDALGGRKGILVRCSIDNYDYWLCLIDGYKRGEWAECWLFTSQFTVVSDVVPSQQTLQHFTL